MEPVDTTISNHLQPFFDEMMPVMKDRNNLDQPCILEQIVAYFEMSFPRHARRTALTTLKPRDSPHVQRSEPLLRNSVIASPSF